MLVVTLLEQCLFASLWLAFLKYRDALDLCVQPLNPRRKPALQMMEKRSKFSCQRPEECRKCAAQRSGLYLVKDILRGCERRSPGVTTRYNGNGRKPMPRAESRYFGNACSVHQEPNHG